MWGNDGILRIMQMIGCIFLLIAALGACRINNLTSNMPKVTGASSKCLLGDVYAG